MHALIHQKYGRILPMFGSALEARHTRMLVYRCVCLSVPGSSKNDQGKKLHQEAWSQLSYSLQSQNESRTNTRMVTSTIREENGSCNDMNLSRGRPGHNLVCMVAATCDRRNTSKGNSMCSRTGTVRCRFPDARRLDCPPSPPQLRLDIYGHQILSLQTISNLQYPIKCVHSLRLGAALGSLWARFGRSEGLGLRVLDFKV